MTATARAAAVLAGAALLVALAFLPRGCAADAPAATGTEAAPPPPGPPLDPEHTMDSAPPGAGPEPPGPQPDPTEHAAPCGGCLPEAGALDVAETFLYHMRRNYIDVRAELYSDIAARLEAAGQGPPHREYLPKLPPGLVDAPADYSMSGRGLPEVERPGETWVVWVQEGWYTGESLESYISEDGPLPPAARSWPPLKWETYLLVDARTGEVDSRVMWRIGTRRYRDMDAYGDRARREAARRAEHWTAKSSATSEER